MIEFHVTVYLKKIDGTISRHRYPVAYGKGLILWALEDNAIEVSNFGMMRAEMGLTQTKICAIAHQIIRHGFARTPDTDICQILSPCEARDLMKINARK